MKNRFSCLMLLLASLAGCASAPPTAVFPSPEERASALDAALEYRQTLVGMSGNELARERSELAARNADPEAQMRLALLHLLPRQGNVELARPLALLESVLKSSRPGALALQPLARLLVEQLNERQRLEGALDRQAQQLKESQKKVLELQEKIDRLAEIERSLPQRPALPAAGSAR